MESLRQTSSQSVLAKRTGPTCIASNTLMFQNGHSARGVRTIPAELRPMIEPQLSSLAASKRALSEMDAAVKRRAQTTRVPLADDRAQR